MTTPLSAGKALNNNNEKILILVRHAESKLNATRKEYLSQPINFLKNGISHCIDPGVKDAPLTPEGQRQAQRAGRRLARDIIMGYLPPIDLVGVSPLRRTLHTSRLLSDSADLEYDKILLSLKGVRNDWWKAPRDSPTVLHNPQRPTNIASLLLNPTSTPPAGCKGVRKLVIVPYLRERKTTSADQPCVRPLQAKEYWKTRPVEVQLLNPRELPSGTTTHVRQAKASTPARLSHFFTIGLTTGCRKVKVESVDSVMRRIILLEAWLKSRSEKVLMLVGHNMIFKAWQRYWQENAASGVQWASREDLMEALTREQRANRKKDGQREECCECGTIEPEQEGSTTSTAASSVDEAEFSCEFERILLQGHVNSSMKVYECPNTGFIIARWRPSTAFQRSQTATP